MDEENYEENNDTGEDTGGSQNEPATADPLAPGERTDARHVYVGRDARGDVWSLTDENGKAIEWAVTPGAPSGAMIPGSLGVLGSGSAPAAPEKTPDDPKHRYVGTDASGDLYEMTDLGGRIIRWAVKVNDDSRNMLPGTASVVTQPAGSNLPPTPAAPVAPTGDGFPIVVQSGKTPDDPSHRYVGTDSRGDIYETTDAGGNRVQWVVPINADSRAVISGTISNLGAATNPPAIPVVTSPTNPLAVPGGVLMNTPQDLTGTTPGQPKQTDARHVFVGRDNRGDVWQIFDGSNVIEWVTKPGDESGNPIAGSARNLGPPSAMTKAQNDGTAQAPGPAPVTMIPAPVTTATATGEKSTVLVMVGIAASLLGAFK